MAKKTAETTAAKSRTKTTKSAAKSSRAKTTETTEKKSRAKTVATTTKTRKKADAVKKTVKTTRPRTTAVKKTAATPVINADNEVSKTETADLFWDQKIVKVIMKYPKTTACVLGALLTAALPPYFQIWALFLAFSGLMLLISGTNRLRKLAAIGYWFGFGYFAAGFYWIGNALLVDIVKTGWLYPIVLLLNGAFFGLFTILPAAATKYGRYLSTKMMLFAAVWCLSAEWLRSFLLTGFPWNPISSVLAYSPAMLQILSVFGTYATSLILILIAMLPAIWLVKPTKWRILSLPAALVALLVIWQFGIYTLDKRPQIPEGHSLIVRLVQPSIPQALKWDRTTLEENLQKYVELSKEKDNSYITFTVWGETAYPFDLLYDYEHNRRIAAAVPPYGYLITGFLRRVDDGYNYTPYNSFGVINRQGELVGWYDKNHLVPFGEYVPFRKYLPEWVRPVANVVAEFGRGEKFKTLQVGNYPEFAPLICYEVIFSDDIVKKGDKRPTWAVVLTNDGWYGMSSGPHQHLVAAQMRAVEEGISIVRSANSGISAIIDPYGVIKAQIPLGERGAVDALVKPEEAHPTLFGQYGNRIPLTLSGMLIVLAVLISLL